jgi:hypothetical protein
MRSAELDLQAYDTDKIPNRYLEHYDPILAPLVHRPMALLELGVYRGGSLRLWHDYFPLGTIVGVDVYVPPDLDLPERARAYQGNQTDPEFLSRVAGETAPDGFDVIIDDASHIGADARAAFWHLFDRHLKPGGLYVIEDWGTGYWDDWADGRRVDSPDAPEAPPGVLPSHSHGMVGFVKQLVDEQGARDASRQRFVNPPARDSRFKEMLITPSIVFVRKAEPAPGGPAGS